MILGVGLLTALSFFALAILIPVRALIVNGTEARRALTETRQALGEQDFPRAQQGADDFHQALRRAQKAERQLRALKGLPLIGTQLRAAEVLLEVGIHLSTALSNGTVAFERVVSPLGKQNESISLATLSPADKRKILERLADARPMLAVVQQEVAEAAVIFRALPARGLIPPVERMIAPLRQQLPVILSSAQALVPATEIIPAIAGFPDQKTYLFLLENNSELRPTGGFIGTFGVLKVSAGEITSFATSDVYDLDKRVEDTLQTIPPTPLQKYNKTTRWFFRDSNWSPDFPTSAEKALDLYRLEGGSEKQFDGVIAITPPFIASLLRLSKEITVDGITFTPENLVDKLQPRANRKELIGEMSKILLNRLLALPQRRWPELIEALIEALDEKHMLLYTIDGDLQQRIIAQNWGGAIRPIGVDGFTIIDANLASLKTDTVMERSVSYELVIKDGRASATVSMTYKNNGAITATTTRYRTYTRVYVPKGSVLETSSGAMKNDKLHGGGAGTVDVFEELERTVFGAFISIEPGATGTLSFTYTLPRNVLEALEQNSYDLLVQKQAGTVAHGLTMSLTFPKSIRSFGGVDGLERVDHTGVALRSDLRSDRNIVVGF